MTFVERSEEMFFPMQDQNRMANFGSFVFAITVYVRRCFWPLKYTRRLYLFGTKTYFDVPRKRFFFFSSDSTFHFHSIHLFASKWH